MPEAIILALLVALLARYAGHHIEQKAWPKPKWQRPNNAWGMPVYRRMSDARAVVPLPLMSCFELRGW